MDGKIEIAFLTYINSLEAKYSCKIDFDIVNNTISIDAPLDVEKEIAIEIGEMWSEYLI